MSPESVQFAQAPYPKDLAERLLRGEIFILRGCMQHLGLFDELRGASLEGVRRFCGDETAARIEREGFESIHEIVDPAEIPALTDRVYEIMEEKGPGWLGRMVRDVFGVTAPFFFERTPNARFHIPYDASVAHKKAYQEFALAHGDGKITAHNPHRDSWVDCPDNLLNLWFAVGRVRTGNGLTIFPDAYGREMPFTKRGYIARGEYTGAPVTFDMEPGDALLFHGDQLHASELNQTDETRHVVSFRVIIGRPHFPYGHYHEYAHSSLAGGPLDALSTLPSKLAWSWVTTRARWVWRDLKKLLRGGAEAAPEVVGSDPEPETEGSVALASLPVGALRPITKRVCVARIDADRVVAFDRACPHEGADLALGSIRDGHIVCPWHNLSFDPQTGASPCQSLRKLRMHETRIDGESVTLRDDRADSTAA